MIKPTTHKTNKIYLSTVTYNCQQKKYEKAIYNQSTMYNKRQHKNLQSVLKMVTAIGGNSLELMNNKSITQEYRCSK